MSRKNMSSRVRIQAYCHRLFTEPQPVPPAFPWISDYYEGLLGPFGLKADLARLEGGTNNDFLAMGREVLSDLQKHTCLDDVSLFLMTHQTMDTYFPFRSVTTRLCREFDIAAPAIGLTEQELSSPYIALTTLQAAFRSGRSAGSGLLLILDQGTLPYSRPGYPAFVIDNALVIKVIADDAHGISMHGTRHWVEKSARKVSWIVKSIYAYLDEQRIDLKDVHLVVDDHLDTSVAAELPIQATVADARLMSSAGLATMLELIRQGCANVLVAHLSKDGHLYLFSFGAPALAIVQEAG